MRLPNKRQTFWLLLAASAATMAFAPQKPFEPLRAMFATVSVPMSFWLYESSQSVRTRATQWAVGSSPGSADATRLQADLDAARQNNVSLRQENDRLRGQVKGATQLRDELLFRGRLIPANVLVRDAISWRDSVLIDKGRNEGLTRQQWATAGVRSFVDRGQDSGLSQNQWAAAVQDDFRRGVLIGQVEQVGQVNARVKLLTDWDSQVAAEVFGPTGAKSIAVCNVKGNGPGRLLAEGVHAPRSQAGDRDTDLPPVNPGDLVMALPEATGLPRPLYIGKVLTVKAAGPGYTLEIEPPDYRAVSRVFIFDLAGGDR